MVEVKISRAGTTAELTPQEEIQVRELVDRRLRGKSVGGIANLSREQELRFRFLISSAGQRKLVGFESARRGAETGFKGSLERFEEGRATPFDIERLEKAGAETSQVEGLAGAERSASPLFFTASGKPVFEEVSSEGEVLASVYPERVGQDISMIGRTSFPELQREPVSVVSAAPQPEGFLESGIAELRDISGGLRTRQQRGEDIGFSGALVGLGAGLGSTTLKAGLFAKSIFTSPISTVKAIPSGLAATGEFVTGGGLATQIREQPFFTTGQVAGEVFLFKGTQLALVKGVPVTKGIITRVDPAFKPVTTTAKGTRTITNLGAIGGAEEIGIIPKGVRKRSPSLDPSVRGPFKFTREQQLAFVGEKGPIVTAQADFRAFGVPLEKELFATPPLEGKGFVRESRLGDLPQVASFEDLISGDFSFRTGKPSIIVFPEERVGRRGGFQIQPKGDELEVTLINQIPKKTGDAGATIFGFRRIPIVTAEIGTGSKEAAGIFKKIRLGDDITTGEAKLFAKETGFKSSDFLPSRAVISPTGLGISSALSIGKKGTSAFSPSKISGRSIIEGVSRGTGVSKPARATTGFGFSGFSGQSIIRGLQGLGGGSGVSPALSSNLFRPSKTTGLLGGFDFDFKPKKIDLLKPERAFRRRATLPSAEFKLFATKPGKLEFTGITPRRLIRRKRKK